MLTEFERNIAQMELEGFYQLKMELVKKLNSLRVTNVSNADIAQGYNIDTKIRDIEKEIKEIDTKILTIKEALVEGETSFALIPPDSPLTSNDDIYKAIEVLNQEAKNLGYNSTKDDIAKIHNLRRKIHDIIFENIDAQLTFVTSKRGLMYSSVLFDTIYTSESLDQVTIGEVLKIREDTYNYKWYDRSIIVSALSLSLINFKFDSKKANLLLDFITDFENLVWERALTGLIISIIWQKNRSWMRSDVFINRLKTLRNYDEIQDALKCIDFILKNELYKLNIINPNMFSIDLFKDPMNYFLPFYDNNEVLKHAIDNASNDFDVTEFQEFLLKTPFLDSYKYFLCVKLAEGTKLKKTKLNDEEVTLITSAFVIATKFSPYQNIISEYYCFFNYFPDKKVFDLFNDQLLLAKTPLKEYVLNRVMQLLLEANTLYKEKKYSHAITKYQDLLLIDKQNKEARWQLANCFLAKGESTNALSLYIELEKEINEKASAEMLYRIASCYNEIKNYPKSNEYCDKITLIVDTPSFNHLLLVAENYEQMSDYPNSEIYCRKAEGEAIDEDDLMKVASIYFSIEKLDDALRITRKVLETKSDEAEYWHLLGKIYCDLLKWDLSISSLTKAINLDKKSPHIKMSLARSFLLSSIDLIRAKKMLEEVLKAKSDWSDITYGNLGHLYLVQQNTEKAFHYYTRCIELLKDEKNFQKRMDSDLKFMVQIGVNESDFNSIKNRTITHYLSTRKI